MVSNLKKGNLFFSQKKYREAILQYGKAISSNPKLRNLLSFNIYVAKNRLKQLEPDNNLLDALQNPRHDLANKILGFCPSIIFDYEFYLENNPDVKESGLDPQDHYYKFGEAEGRRPNRYFNPAYYGNTYDIAQNHSGSLFEHYIRFGIKNNLKIDNSHSKETYKNGKTLLLVSHDTEVGGAQQVIKLFAKWILSSTPYDVQFIAINRGGLHHTFEEIAPCLTLSNYKHSDRKSIVKNWLKPNTCACFINSIASANILNYIDNNIPSISFIHEMPKILDSYRDNVELLKKKNIRVLAGSSEVGRAFLDQYGFHPAQVYNSVSFIENLSDQDLEKSRNNARIALQVPEKNFLIFGCGVLHWRKSPKTFIEVAERVLCVNNNVEFVWIGGGPDQEECEELIRSKGLEKQVKITGYEPNVASKLAGGDLFLLTSEEDPFPLVALYAAQSGMPIVCFKDAGGIEGFVESGSGVSTPFMDVEKMADSVIEYINNPTKCTHDGEIGKRQVALRHTVNVVAPTLMHHIRDVAQLNPSISVVVPNYNYELYLEERLDSITNQTFQDFEVILLDDCSSDKSVQILEKFVSRRPGTQLVVNKENSGSPFIQWLRGMKLANSNLIWLAEADDRCAPNLLEEMLPIFEDRNIFIASCGSRPITSEGNVIGDYRELYLDRICEGRWDQDYVATDHDEANFGLGIANSIPNASAVIFRKFSPNPQFEDEVTSMRLCGDWYFYLRAMQGGLIGFKSAIMNDHRRHGNTVTHNLEGSLRYFDELATVRSYINQTYSQSSDTLESVCSFLEQDIKRFRVENADKLPSPIEPKKLLPTLLVVAPDLSPGGGQIFAISLANEWVLRGGRCLLLNVGNQKSHPEVVKQISDRVIYYDLKKQDYDLKTIIKDFDIDVIHSCIWWADRWVYGNRNDLPENMPWIITMHGCHETILHNPQIDPTFLEKITGMSQRAEWVYTADKNLEIFDAVGQPKHLIKIPNGTKDQSLSTRLSRYDLGICNDAIVFCLASRAIESKGWFESVRLAERLVREGHNVKLLLIGEGPAADSVREMSPDNVLLVGQVSNLHDYLNLCDIGVLPSYFEGESFPLILLEMMCNSLPIIASDIGEIPSMICEGPNPSGIIIPRQNSGINEEEFYKASLLLLEKQVRSTYSKNARSRYVEKFSIKKMVDAYSKLYSISKPS